MIKTEHLIVINNYNANLLRAITEIILYFPAHCSSSKQGTWQKRNRKTKHNEKEQNKEFSLLLAGLIFITCHGYLFIENFLRNLICMENNYHKLFMIKTYFKCFHGRNFMPGRPCTCLNWFEFLVLSVFSVKSVEDSVDILITAELCWSIFW